MKHILWGILLVVLVGCGETAPGSSNSHFQTMRVERQDLTQDRQFTARIESQQNIDVRPLITGIVQKICVKEGARQGSGLHSPRRTLHGTAEPGGQAETL